MKRALRLLLSARWLFVLPAVCLIIAWEYVWTGKVVWGDGQEKGTDMPEPTVGRQQKKCKTLLEELVAWVNQETIRIRRALEAYEPSDFRHPVQRQLHEELKTHGEWILGARVVLEVQQSLYLRHIHTTGEVLAKELRKAQRKGEIQKRIRPGTVYVEYTANAPTGLLLDNSLTHHGE